MPTRELKKTSSSAWVVYFDRAATLKSVKAKLEKGCQESLADIAYESVSDAVVALRWNQQCVKHDNVDKFVRKFSGALRFQLKVGKSLEAGGMEAARVARTPSPSPGVATAASSGALGGEPAAVGAPCSIAASEPNMDKGTFRRTGIKITSIS